MEEEIWKDIPGYEGLYMVSNLGNVKSLNYRKSGKERILNPYIQPTGYIKLTLYKNHKATNYSLHRLVYQTFVGDIPNDYIINHNDENPTNNRLDNLSLMTQKENVNYGTGIERCVKANAGFPRNPRKIICVETGIIYKSIRDAEYQTHILHNNICKACKGKYKTAGGYHWKYIENGEF